MSLPLPPKSTEEKLELSISISKQVSVKSSYKMIKLVQ